ncbi:MAG: GH36 C-terminal domain-containing protein, partial [Clostridia bacterium]|nr:GH36 C-terminal domain-containing protein [Clostridia bacterium]
SKDTKQAYVAGQRLRSVPLDKNNIVRLTGLDENKTYRIEELGFTASGATLTRFGVLLPRITEYESWTWHIHEA